MPTFSTRLRPRRCLLALGAWLLALTAQASTGLMVLPAPPGGGPVTLVYPSASPAQTVQRMARDFTLAQDGVPQRGNGRLVVLSHGSGGNPWVHSDLTRELLGDPPGFDRSVLPQVDASTVAFFAKHLQPLKPATPSQRP